MRAEATAEPSADPPAGPQTEQERGPVLLLVLLVGTCVLVFLRTAWISEDAYITFRTVDNLLDGYGLRWNIAERVQTFTHPLWMMVVTLFAAFTREFFFTVSVLSITVSTLAVWVLAGRVARNASMAVIAILVLMLSRSFVDYSTSGLENPLTHLLLAVALLLYFRISKREREPMTREALLLALVAGLGVLNRMDTALIFLPPVVHVAIRLPRWRPRLALAGLCLGPIAAWSLFSLFYYGFPLPNTAYAKLLTGVPRPELVEQGLYYLLNSLSWDPLTLLVVGAVGFHALFGVRKEVHRAVVATGLLLYIYYLVRIGGDFMSGRFFSAPLFVATALLVHWRPLRLREAAMLAVPILALGLSSGKVPLKSSGSHKNDQIDARGIADERGFYYPKSGLLQASRSTRLPRHENCDTGHGVRRSGRPVAVEPNIGFMAWCAGPNVHFVDNLALGDAMLSRLPIETTKGEWRIGHFARQIPEGYEEALKGEGKIDHASLRTYWNSLTTVTRGDLLSWRRFREIWYFNTGQHDHLIEDYIRERYFVLDPEEAAKPKEIGTPWDDPGNRILNRHGVGIAVTWKDTNDIAVSLADDERYTVVYLRKGRVIHRQPVDVPEGTRPGLVVVHIRVPARARASKFDLVRVVPDGDPGQHSVGHFRIMPKVTHRRLADLRKADKPLDGRVLRIALGKPMHRRMIKLAVERTRRYRVAFARGNIELSASFLQRYLGKKEGIHTHRITVAPAVSERGYDVLLVEALPGYADDGPSQVGRVSLR